MQTVSPLEHFVTRVAGRTVRIALKLEGYLRYGSSKDRTARAMVDDLRQRGLLRPGTRVVESSSGNLAVALAGYCREAGVPFVAVVDPKTTRANLDRLRDLGAEIVVADRADGSAGYLFDRLVTVRRLLRESPRTLWTNQYENPANPRAHYESTATEILAQTRGDVDAVFVAVSTGGTLAGVGRRLREHNPKIRRVAVDVRGSRALPGPGPSTTRHLPGIGSSRVSTFLREGAYDEAVIVGEAEAVATCHRIENDTGLMLGGSAGAVVAACLRWLTREKGGARPVCICPDLGEGYRDTLYDRAWLESHGFAGSVLPPGRFDWDRRHRQVL